MVLTSFPQILAQFEESMLPVGIKCQVSAEAGDCFLVAFASNEGLSQFILNNHVRVIDGEQLVAKRNALFELSLQFEESSFYRACWGRSLDSHCLQQTLLGEGEVFLLL
jgi:hypothetical protein